MIRVESRPTLYLCEKKIIEAWIEESEFPQLQKMEADPVQHRYGGGENRFKLKRVKIETQTKNDLCVHVLVLGHT